ncbi:integrin beta-like protein 1 [Ruditapes philippinarum]|uniref:integrin beta-like protein 1 n=1 Tax=Ruditapes philippinarum TaxID=129788 RepID=UPI00295BF3D0|nr:integrin beta-like protein 1 [Ruditapes philippinarum]
MKYYFVTITLGMVFVHYSKAALPTGCDADGVDCPEHSTCGTDKNCACNDGFKLNSNQDGCEAKVINDICDDDKGCTGLSNTACTGGKCVCSDGYAEKNSVCTKTVSGTTCTAAGTECKGIDNSHCDTDKCKCNDGYVMNVEVCTAENAATHVQLGVLTLYLSFVLAMAQKLF